jgi:thiol-disulfide isomerase/thioredoxin
MFESSLRLARRGKRALFALGLLLALALVARPIRAEAQTPSEGSACGAASTCPLDDPLDAAAEPARPEASSQVPFLFFWGIGCPHCEEAKPLVEAITREEPRLAVEAIEVRKDPAGRQRFLETMKRLGAEAAGIPTFVVGEDYVVGYTKGETDKRVRALIAARLRPRSAGAASTSDDGAPAIGFRVPWFGEIDPRTVSLPGLTLGIGLADGLNPCAIWVLVVLLGILLHVESTPRMLLYAGTFVVMSGVVYFVFMSAWATLFALAGLSRAVTMILGAALIGMGIVNLKDVLWFKKGPSLVIPDKVKPSLFRRMRAIAGAATTPAALLGITVLAFVVNLVELGCTLGLPAIYTRILALRGLTAAPRFAYLALYNLAYVVPLLLVVAVFIGLKRRLVMTERVARGLKALSGLLLASFGGLFVLAPDLLVAR